jgi:glycosyltransferase involved in cell wall biosynthesis
MIEQIKKDFILSKNWSNLEPSQNNILFRWSFTNSKIYIRNSEFYTFIKLRIYNGTKVFKKRRLSVFIDDSFHKEYTFTDLSEYIDIKLDIKNKKSISFVTDDYFCPNKIDENVNDFRLLGFKFYSVIVDSENQENVLLSIKDLSIEQEESFFIDSSKYNFNISKLGFNSTKPTIFYVAQYGTSGYATAAKGYLCEYFINGHDVSWHPLKFDDSNLSKDCSYNIIAESLIGRNYGNYDMFIYHSTPDLWSGLNEKFRGINKGKKIIGYTTWETNVLPEKWVKSINEEVSEVWCPSNYNLETFKNSGVTIPIKVVPHVFLEKPLLDKKDILLYDTSGQVIEFKNDVYTFYTIGEFNERKGIDDTINAFCQTFTSNDKVRLIIKTHYKSYSSLNKQYCLDKIESILKNYGDKPEIHYIIDNLTEKELLGLHSLGDCYVSLTKSEGFGLTIFDAFKYGKKIITTAYSGHMDFLGENYKGLVSCTLNKVRNMQTFSSNYSEDTIWAYPDLTHAKELMKGIVNK